MMGRSNNAFGATAPAAPRARANNPPQVPFAHKLVLNQWLMTPHVAADARR